MWRGTRSVTCSESGHAAKLVQFRATSISRKQSQGKRRSLFFKRLNQGPLIAEATATASRATVGISPTCVTGKTRSADLLEVLPTWTPRSR